MKRREIGNVSILTPKGYLTGGEETDQLEAAIQEIAGRGQKHLILDLSETQHLNSSAMGVLISAHVTFARRGGTMSLTAVDKRIENVFVITKLSIVFSVFESVDQAMARIAESEKTPRP